MLHEAAPEFVEAESIAEKKASIGIRYFFVYAIIYTGFVAIAAIKYTLMQKTLFWGLNLAVVYGFGLIVLALVLAMMYNATCTRIEKESANPVATDEQAKEGSN